MPEPEEDSFNEIKNENLFSYKWIKIVIIYILIENKLSMIYFLKLK